MTLDKLKTKKAILKEILVLLFWSDKYSEHKTIGQLEEDYQNGTFGLAESLNELQSYQYSQETNLGDLDAEFNRIDTFIHNLNIEKTIPDNRIEIDDNFQISYL